MEEYQLTEADIQQLRTWGFDLDEIKTANRRVYSYEDWLDPNRSMGPFPFGGWGIHAQYLTPNGDSTTKGNGKLTLFILPKREGQKIERRKDRIIESFVKEYLTALIEWFQGQYEKSLEKKIFVQQELKKVEKLLFEWHENYSYHSYAEGFWLSFYTCANHKKGSMCDWYEQFCVKGEDPKRAVARHHATMTATELNSAHPETLHFVVAALAFHQYKEYLNDVLETIEPIQLTFEDWKFGSEYWQDIFFKSSEHPVDQPFDRRRARGKDGKFRFYSLSNDEYKKIACHRDDIFERKVALYLQGQIKEFEQKFSTSLERSTLIESELQKVNELLANKTLRGSYFFPIPNGSTYIFSNFEDSIQAKGKDANPFPYWYDQIIVQGKDACIFIEARHEKALDIPYPVAVHVLYRYRQFLETRITEITKQSAGCQLEVTNIPSKTLALYCFYRESKGEYPELEGLSRKEIAEKIAKENGLSPNNFRQDLSAMKNKAKRLVRENIPRIQQAIEMLADYPKSLQYAQDELRVLQIRAA